MESPWEDQINFENELKKPISKMKFDDDYWFPKKPLIYISHPFLTNGNPEENLTNVSKILEELVLKYKDKFIFISPIHNFGTLDGALNYDDGLKICMNLLKRCDGIVMCGDYIHSNGCMKEMEYAIRRGMPIWKLEDFK